MAGHQQKSTDQQEATGKKEVGLDMKYVIFDATLHHNDKVASCRLRMPHVLPRGFTEHGDDATLSLHLLTSDKGWTHSLKLMKEIVHPNILHARIIHENEMQKSSKKGLERSHDYWALVETYTDNLFDYLGTDLGISLTTKSGMVLLPTDCLRNIVGQIVDGLEHLMNLGHYHGNFSLKGTYYHQQKHGSISVKLAGFEKKTGKKTLWQKEDLLALGGELEQLSEIAEGLNLAGDVKNNCLHIDTYQMDDLVKKLKNVTEANLPHIYSEIKRHPFFWNEDHRRYFLVYEVAVAIKKEDRFKSRIEGREDLCALPWDADDYDGFLSKMNKHRISSGRKAYNGNSKWAFVKFIIGLYTHEPLLKNEPNKVDNSIMKRHPRIYVFLRSLIGSHYSDWM